MIIEIRRYTCRTGRREDFIAYFESTNRPALGAAGMRVFGPMRDTENQDMVHWLRAFETQAPRHAIKDAFYDGAVWNNDVEPVVMPMIEKFEASVVETTDRFLGFADTPSI